MGYYNPIHQYGEEKFVKAAKEAGTSRAKLKYQNSPD
jgi:tryptophan synthase alpha subunit